MENCYKAHLSLWLFAWAMEMHRWMTTNKKNSQIKNKIILNRYYTSRRVQKGTKSVNQVAATKMNQTNR